MNNLTSTDKTEERICLLCEETFIPEFDDQFFCSDDCEYEEDNSDWRKSEYDKKDISDWEVDDHLAAWYDDMMEK